jgi:UDP-perosamine 4-acetyltransferase
MTRPLLILGAGGHARVLLDALVLQGRQIIGFLDPALPEGSVGPGGLPILGGDEALSRFLPADVELVNGIGSVKVASAREMIYRRVKVAGFGFADVVHPSAIVCRDVVCGEGTQIMAGCVIQCGSLIGANSVINTRASIDHDCRIGESVHIAPGVTLSGNVQIGDRAHIGTGAVVIQGISVGEGCLVAAGAVVYRDLAAGQRFIPRH